MSVLAHVVAHSSLAPEPAATQALGYILDEPDALAVFVAMLSEMGVSLRPSRVGIEIAIGAGRPDLSIYDERGTHRVLVENKFWAGLTGAQPAAYLDELPKDDEGSALMFIAPTARVPSIWEELKRRCSDSELEVSDEQAGKGLLSAKLSDERVIGVTSWQRVLDRLESIKIVQSDVRQLRALTDQMDAEAFLPIRPDELTRCGLGSAANQLLGSRGANRRATEETRGG